MKIEKLSVILLLFCAILFYPVIAPAEDGVGTMVAVKGRVLIDRDQKTLETKMKDSILVRDTVSTLEASRAKMLFVDDSMLTLGEKSKAVIRELVFAKDKRGKSVFSLLEGKMRSIVGKSDFEVHTPTSVAAARGTIILFETGIMDGKRFTIILCIEGIVTGMSADEKITGSFRLEPGMTITLIEGEPVPEPVAAPPSLINRLMTETDVIHELSVPGPAAIIVAPDQTGVEMMKMLPLSDQDPGITVKPTTPVNIDLDWQK
ncbi:MAG: FecR family protein [Nitrospirota bacterium]